MKDIDRLIKKYGAEKLVEIIIQRKDFAQNFKKRGRKAREFYKIWDLKEVYLKFESKYPAEDQESIAERMLVFVRNYRGYQQRPDIYCKELKAQENLYFGISWLPDDLSPKRIINMISEINVEQRQRAKLFVDDVFNKMDFSSTYGWEEGDDPPYDVAFDEF